MRRRNLAHMWTEWAVVEFGCAMPPVIQSTHSGRMEARLAAEDAHSHPLPAARFLEESSERDCPICEQWNATNVANVYVDELGRFTRRVKASSDLRGMAREYVEFRVCVVEVCQGCAWNHLTVWFVPGTGTPPGPSLRFVRDDSHLQEVVSPARLPATMTIRRLNEDT